MSISLLLELILPEGLLEYFEVSDFVKEEGCFRIYLIEKNIHPKEYISEDLISKGFFDEITVQDFPIRGQKSYLHIKRRKWLDKTSGIIVSRNWDIVAKGTRMTQEFANFLKAILRYEASKCK
jgi:hypothetical protein